LTHTAAEVVAAMVVAEVVVAMVMAAVVDVVMAAVVVAAVVEMVMAEVVVVAMVVARNQTYSISEDWKKDPQTENRVYCLCYFLSKHEQFRCFDLQTAMKLTLPTTSFSSCIGC
jgi:hypothetical protein